MRKCLWPATLVFAFFAVCDVAVAQSPTKIKKPAFPEAAKERQLIDRTTLIGARQDPSGVSNKRFNGKNLDGWIELFNGRDLTGWVVEGTKENNNSGEAKPVWSVQDGVIHCEGTGFGFLRFDRQWCDFVLHVEYRLTKGCNSGVGIRHVKYTGQSKTRPSYSGYEVQLLDDGGKQPNKGSSASLYRYVAPKALPVKKPGEWNTIEIECRGPRIKIMLNGELVQDVDQSKIDEIKDKPLCGYVSVQNHGKTIDFRNLRLKDLRSD